ncbi:hypothetical protein KUTeg_000418 [Tegillarca granosa]|uniref:MKRN2 opposite strand protein n=1 Tax=Tegillarca granosa TaxID=220873 RepID=A0ABQ9FYJ5_TEGGR|nr:hypothetical protein KUTeg_000418 [Tegillarca granosa]
MEEPPAVKCFQHCDRQTNILCFMLPHVCPLCGEDTLNTESRIPPYQIPSPFVNARQHACSVVIRPTTGTFLRDYENNSNLHVGVTNSRGDVYDFDEEGIHVNNALWENCIAIPIIQTTNTVCQNWDTDLVLMSQNVSWSKKRYNEVNYNCFDFVISFLRHVLPKWKIHENKTRFCEEFILPHTAKVAKYIGIYRNVQKHGYVCQNVS